ncbi:S-adenosyl-L-methionine-dependent methyltransferase [Syncephalastrum racemosum]|uniref:Protein-lysine N-methyltransferase EFM4 n=1 Tax=Syncephalastrum racemosum TaxID=13706 RepID=A0A1X2H523_SYNRA|nr:S-adenosyl-L-methionine-dependent methyltransferase [Syncephalastrum racemosum]
MSEDDGDFAPSKLGTKDHWDNFYEAEYENYNDHGDEGEIWFGHQAEQRMLQWIRTHVTDQRKSFVDIGCGNGHLLLEIGKSGYSELTGVDYSATATRLARKLSKDNEVPVEFETVDILDPTCAFVQKKRFDVVLDKGTYDAISLSADKLQARRNYLESVSSLMSPAGSFFLITSCNWTVEELKQHFAPHFRYHSQVDAPVFSFGGQKGAQTCTVAFQLL